MTPTATDVNQNGHDPAREQARSILIGEPLSEGYKPTVPPSLLSADGAAGPMAPIYLSRDIELMMTHPVVLNSLSYFKSGIAAVEFETTADTPEVEEFCLSQCQRFWDRGVPLVQGGYDYGWIGGEHLYTEEDGPLAWDDLVQFSPLDSFLLTCGSRPVGVRVKNIRKAPTGEKDKDDKDTQQNQGEVDLWLGSDDVPAKALWYAHEPRYNSWYGRSQLLGSWRPWRRLAGKDGAETVADTGVYRFAYCGPIVRYPNEDYAVAATAGAPNTTANAQGLPIRYARDMARMIAEWAKAGAGVGLPSDKYPPEMGGGDKWAMEFPKSTLNIDGLISYIKHLWEQISSGIGVPPELLGASEEGGGGYSGRKIPREAFLMRQQRIADAILRMFVKQVLRPLVRWNFGPVKFDVKVKNILMSERKAMTGQEEGAAPPPSPDGAAPPAPQGGGLPQQSPTLGRPPGWLDARGIDNVPQPQEGPGAFSLTDARRRVEEVALRILGRVA